MKQLQNNFTTPEQSKRLLELGVPKDSSDMFYMTDVSEIPTIKAHAYGHIPIKELSIPCWSVGQLMKIVFISMGKKGDMLPRLHFEYDPTKEINIIEDLVDLIEYPEYKLDFSKLED